MRTCELAIFSAILSVLYHTNMGSLNQKLLDTALLLTVLCVLGIYYLCGVFCLHIWSVSFIEVELKGIQKSLGVIDKNLTVVVMLFR